VEVIDGRAMRTKNHVKGLRDRDYAAMLRQLCDYLRQAVLRVREAVSDDAAKTPKADHIFLRDQDQGDHSIPTPATPEKPPDPPAPAKPPAEPTEPDLVITLTPHAAPKEEVYYYFRDADAGPPGRNSDHETETNRNLIAPEES